MKEPRCPGREAFLDDAKDLSDEAFKRIVFTRGRRLLDASEMATFERDDDRVGLEQGIAEHFERIHRGRDFLPARFLADGAAAARAVGRISTPTSLGTGFLIVDGVILTNNHVISSAAEAGGSTIEFELDGQTVVAALRPDLLFLTHAPLDYTFVALETRGLPDITPIGLTRTPAGVTRNERVNIVQHPQGRPKEVALHDNHVVRVLDRVVRYRTDTEPGSSGSPVFNNEWELVALHHAGWREGDGQATNEGIQISAIVDHLIRGTESARRNERLESLRNSIQGSSPFLGFFDAAGLASDPFEVVVDSLSGNEQFADVGFWNIEHFNDGVASGRIDEVADVLTTLNMDAIGLTEVQAGALERLREAMASRGGNVDFVLENVRGSQDIAVLYDKNTTTVRKRDDLNDRFRQRLDARTPSGRTAFPRDPLFAHCSVDPRDAQAVEFLMIVVHFKAFGDSQSRARRRLASEKLSEIIAAIRESEDLPIVLGGDFNELLGDDVLAPLHDSPDMFALTADDAAGGDPGAISYVGRRHRSLIDHIVISSDVTTGDIQGDDAAIVRLDRTVANFADRVSDHVPVVFRMVMREAPVDVDPPVLTPPLAQFDIPSGADKVQLVFADLDAESAQVSADAGEAASKPKPKRKKKSSRQK